MYPTQTTAAEGSSNTGAGCSEVASVGGKVRWGVTEFSDSVHCRVRLSADHLNIRHHTKPEQQRHKYNPRCLFGVVDYNTWLMPR